MDPAFPARLPLEVLDRVRDVGRTAVDPDRLERLVEDAPRRADERLARAVLLVARLLADEHRGRVHRPLPEHRLGADLPQVAALTAGGGLPQRGQAQLLRKEVRSRPGRRRACHPAAYSLDRGIRDRETPEML